MIPSREQVSATSSKADSAGDDRDLSGDVDHACALGAGTKLREQMLGSAE
jgi:hypothetical protein